MLYMKTRVTFRIANDLADALRDLPNQTHFVEQALREALREECPACGGTGRVSARGVTVSNFRLFSLPPLRREAAVQLKSIVGLARRAAATDVRLRSVRGKLCFELARGAEILLEGSLGPNGAHLGATPRS